MSTPPNPSATPTEPAGTPIPETAPAPQPSPSPENTPEATPPPQDTPGPSLEKTAAPGPAASPSAEETPAANPAAPAPGPAAPAASPFAPPTPAPPAGPGFGAPTAPGAPGPSAPAPFPGNPWAQPGPGYGGPGYGAPGYPTYAQPAPATGNGLAVSAAIVGGLGILIGLVPLLFWAGFLLGLVAIGLGIGAIVRASKGAPQKTLSIVGTVLGVVALAASVGGLFLTALFFEKTADRRADERAQQRRELDKLFPDAGPSKSPKPSQVPGLSSALPFGETFSYDSGVQVSLSVPTKYEPKDELARKEVKNAIQITVTITNGSKEPYEVGYPMPNVRDEQGMTADDVIDFGGNVPKRIKGAIMPGQSAKGVVAFEVPKGTKNITADITIGFDAKTVKYAGPIG
ncbi:DUF4190 domain-containing protein [Streptomyces sp. NPDC096339]|uniref:DUF4190 domain-containing protein n=1 Tax=Streptomyces sp. NPDC096339 TaxID=3366086 RepID=UPI00382721EC